MVKRLLIILALVLVACFAFCDDYSDRDTLVRETCAFFSSPEYEPPEALYAEAYDDADKIYPVVLQLRATLERDLGGDIELSASERHKARRLLEAWLEHGVARRDPESMICCSYISNSDYAYGMLDMSQEESQRLCQEAFAILRDKPDKTSDQWEELIICYAQGTGTDKNFAAAREAWERARAEAAAGRIEPIDLWDKPLERALIENNPNWPHPAPSSN